MTVKASVRVLLIGEELLHEVDGNNGFRNLMDNEYRTKPIGYYADACADPNTWVA
jgi:hypothetical protein